MFKYIIGTATPVASTADYTHTFAIVDNPPSATIQSSENSTTDTGLRMTGMIAESAELSIALNENMKLTATFKGKSAVSSPNASAAVLSTLAVFPHALCDVQIQGVSATEIQSASVSFNKVVSRSGGIGSNLYQQGHATDLNFEFAAKLGFTDSQFQTLFLSGTATPTATVSPATTADPQGVTFKLQADNEIALGSGRREISVTLDNCIFSKFTKSVTVGDLVFIDIAGTGTLSELFTVSTLTEL